MLLGEGSLHRSIRLPCPRDVGQIAPDDLGRSHAQPVRQHLDASGTDSVLLDTADLPTSVELTTWTQPGGGMTEPMAASESGP